MKNQRVVKIDKGEKMGFFAGTKPKGCDCCPGHLIGTVYLLIRKEAIPIATCEFFSEDEASENIGKFCNYVRVEFGKQHGVDVENMQEVTDADEAKKQMQFIRNESDQNLN